MKELIDKISSYNIFNYLLPGILFVVIAKYTLDYNFVQNDILLGSFLYYFIGLIISRFGSLVIERILIKIKFIQYSNYNDFIQAQKQDVKIDSLLEMNNMFRTLISMGVLLLILFLYKLLSDKFTISNTASFIVFVIFIVVLFLFSYKKQTEFIRKRVDYYLSKVKNEN